VAAEPSGRGAEEPKPRFRNGTVAVKATAATVREPLDPLQRGTIAAFRPMSPSLSD
jgi:hypothetical protein